jgi:hypothetical protein
MLSLSWLLENPARLMVCISLGMTFFIAFAEFGGRRSGGSGWLTLARIGFGGIFTLATAIVAGIYGGVGAFFGYLVLQLFVCILLPTWLVESM